jgi:decaprenylphospho-beta-D-ribofuranose 2-oxidase
LIDNNINSWGNIYTIKTPDSKDVSFKTSVLDVGNLNSYGDCCIPKEAISSLNKKAITKMSVFEYQKNTQSYLFGTPGKSNVTLAGAIAADTHGKDNDWGGSFYKNVEEITLSINGRDIVANREINKELFNATFGGYGLTGSITDIKFFNKSISLSENYETTITTGKGLDSLISSFDTKRGQYWVAWVDLLSKNFNWVTKISNPNNFKVNELIEKRDVDFNVSLPFIGKNRFKILRMINFLYFKKHSYIKKENKNFFETFYPLSFITDTRNISSKRRIVQVQFSIPTNHEDKLEQLLFKLIQKQKPILCSVKKMGKQEVLNNLSFYQEGWTFAVDFPYEEFNPEEVKLFYKELIKYGGKIYLAKDSHLEERDFKLMYPEFMEWRNIVKEIDPNKTYQSELSVRLGLKNW